MRKTIIGLYDDINKEAIRLMLAEGLSREDAYARAVPEHFHKVADLEDKLPSEFVELVWAAVNTKLDRSGEPKVTTGEICVELRLPPTPWRFKVLAAFHKLRRLGYMRMYNGKSWARVDRENPVEDAVAAESASD